MIKKKHEKYKFWKYWFLKEKYKKILCDISWKVKYTSWENCN